jgi:lipid II:glycine glycyltransferase (peptidoglycan interpeptide bridge formation enzyme)
MRKTTRYLVKKAMSLGVEVKQVDNLESFNRLYIETARRQGFMGHKDIEAEYEVFYGEKRAFILEAAFENNVIAAGIYVISGDELIYRHGASLTSNIPASYLMQWSAIKKAKELGLLRYNFWGIAPSDNPRHPWRGITMFKTGFGGSPIRFMDSFDLVVSPLYIISFMIESFRKIRKGY